MDLTIYLVIIAGFYLILLFFDSIFKSCSHYPYYRFLQLTGLKVKAFIIQWDTTVFNRLLLRWGSNYTRFFNLWFDFGMIVTILLLPIVMTLLLIATFQIVLGSTPQSDRALIIEPVILGVNVPASELIYYCLTLIFCSIVHELGHALAAVKEGVHLINVGVIVLFIIPVAYVNISTEKLHSVGAWKALRIICAGAWHNVVLAAIAFVVYLALPYVFATMFYVNSGVYVSHVEGNSPLMGVRGLHAGDIVTMINDCYVRDAKSWSNCLIEAQRFKPGFCVNTDVVLGLDESVPIRQLPNGGYDCCEHNRPEWLCFEYIDEADGVAELPPHMCLPARKIVETFNGFCNVNGRMCAANLHCIHPLLQNATNLLKLKRVQKADVLYMGHPLDVLNGVRVSSYIPKVWFETSWIPDTTLKMLEYVVLFSLGLAVVNVVPCIYMDGQYIAKYLVEIVLNEQSPRVTSMFAACFTLCGTAFLVFHCLYAILQRFYPTYAMY